MSKPDNLRERVAYAIAEADGYEDQWEAFLDAADAAMAVMADPKPPAGQSE